MDKQGYSGLCIGGPLHGERKEHTLPFFNVDVCWDLDEPVPDSEACFVRYIYEWVGAYRVWRLLDLSDDQVAAGLPPVNVRALTFFCEPDDAYLRFTMTACDEFGRRAQSQFSRDQIWHFDDALGEALSHDPRRDARDAFVWLHPILSSWAGIVAGRLLKGGAQ